MRLTTGLHDTPLGHTFERGPGFPFWTLSMDLGGVTQVTAGGVTLDHTGPAIMLYPPETPYRLNVIDGPYWAYYAIFDAREAWRQWLAWPTHPSGVREVRLDPAQTAHRRAIRAIKAVHAVRTSSLPIAEAFAINAMERALLRVHLINPEAALAQLDARVRAAMQYMGQRLAEPTTVADIAEAVALSESHFAHLFSEQVGQAPMKYLEQLRMQRAQEMMLSTEMAVADVAAAVGYDNPFHFSTRFRACTGQSPRAFKARPRG